jgi:fumarate reductase flavoprotein subunit
MLIAPLLPLMPKKPCLPRSGFLLHGHSHSVVAPLFNVLTGERVLERRKRIIAPSGIRGLSDGTQQFMKRYDAVIVGAGAAGLSAAAYAAALDVHVLLLDCSDGSSSDFSKSGGGPAAAGTRFQEQAEVMDTPELWLEDIRRKTGNLFDKTITHLVVNRARDAIHFQAAHLSMDIHLVRNIPVAGHTVSRLHGTPRESGREYAESLAAAVARLPQVIRRNDAEVTGLLVDDDAVRGVRARIRGRDQAIEAPFTLLACGGFAANCKMIGEFIPEIAGALHIGCPNNTGRGLSWARALGAATSFLDSYQGHGHVTADGKGRLGLGLTSLGAIIVDFNGRRFVREDIGPSELAAHVLAAPQGGAIEVYDERIHGLASSMEAYRQVVERGAAQRFETAGGLACAFGLPTATFVATLDAANNAARGEVVDHLNRTAFAKVLIPPLWGVRIIGALAHTQGGVRVNEHAEVITTAGDPIRGLLAAGGVATGISGQGAAGYSSGNGLAQAFALGTIAAETISRRCRLRGTSACNPR